MTGGVTLCDAGFEVEADLIATAFNLAPPRGAWTYANRRNH